MKVLGTRIVVEREIESVIKIADAQGNNETANYKKGKGKVIKVGPGSLLPNGEIVPPYIKEGDRVLFMPNAGTEIIYNGKKYLLMDEGSVLMVLENDETGDLVPIKPYASNIQ
jgi:chaperonin GroES